MYIAAIRRVITFRLKDFTVAEDNTHSRRDSPYIHYCWQLIRFLRLLTKHDVARARLNINPFLLGVQKIGTD